MYAKSVAQIKSWQVDGYDTMAIICRDEKETKEVVKITLEDQVNKIMRGEENGKN